MVTEVVGRVKLWPNTTIVRRVAREEVCGLGVEMRGVGEGRT
jgi:hypothetical protein